MNLGNLRQPPELLLRKHLEAQLDVPSAQMKGYFTVELLDAQTGFVKQRLDFANTITDAGLDGMINQSIGGLKLYAGVGTGSTAPTNGDTTLQAEVAPASSNRSSDSGTIQPTTTYTPGPPDYFTNSQTYLFGTSQANGNLTEIGLFQSSTGGTMWARQLLKDGTGTPTVITKTSSDQLRVTYSLRAYPPTADVTGNIVISGVSYAYVIRAKSVANTQSWPNSFFNFGPSDCKTTRNIKAYDGAIGQRNSQPSGNASQSTSVSIAAYIAGTFYIDKTVVWDATVANYAGGILAVTPWATFYDSLFQIGFTPAIMKDNTKQLTLVFRNSWGRYP